MSRFVQHLLPVCIVGVSGKWARIINGIYDPTDEQLNERPVFRHVGGETCLRFVAGKWRVQARHGNEFARSVHSNLALPQHAKLWLINETDGTRVCKHGHVLAPHQQHIPIVYYCDVCNECLPSGARVYACASCNYGTCQKCYSGWTENRSIIVSQSSRQVPFSFHPNCVI